MALFKGLLVSKVSGSIGGITFSHNKGGPYFRSRATPTDPNSPQQQAVRAIVGQLSNHWINTLTAAQRESWATYAANVTVLDPFGDPRYIPPLSHFVRSNTPRLQAGRARVDDAPTIFNTGDFTSPSFAVSEATQQVSVTFGDSDPWCDEDGSAMLIYGSRPQNPTINFFKGPYRFAGPIPGSSTLPPTTPQTIAIPFAAIEGQKTFWRAIVTRADGRLSLSFRDLATVAA